MRTGLFLTFVSEMLSVVGYQLRTKHLQHITFLIKPLSQHLFPCRIRESFRDPLKGRKL